MELDDTIQIQVKKESIPTYITQYIPQTQTTAQQFQPPIVDTRDLNYNSYTHYNTYNPPNDTNDTNNINDYYAQQYKILKENLN